MLGCIGSPLAPDEGAVYNPQLVATSRVVTDVEHPQVTSWRCPLSQHEAARVWAAG